MNQLHLLRLLIPTAKGTLKIFNPKDINKPFIKQNKPSRPPLIKTQIESTFPTEEVIHERPYELGVKSQAKVTQTEQQTDDLSVDESHLPQIAQNIKKNQIDHRVKSLQYQANGPCEDSIVQGQLKTVNAYTVSVFDGHGGPQLAEYSRQKINSFIDSYLKDHLDLNKTSKAEDIGKVLKNSLVWSYRKLQDTFFQIYEQHLKLGNKKIKSVGTCGITAIVHNDKVYIGNSGDSMGMFILSEGSSLMRSQKTNQRLSVSSRTQRQRLKEQWKGVDEDIISQEANSCFYLKGRLQPTRTIGDYYLKKQQYYNGQGQFKGPYLSCEPDVNEFKLTQSHKYMVLASDGLWDVLSRNEVMASLMNGKEIDLNKTCYEQQREEDCPYIKHTLESTLKRCCDVSGKSFEEVKRMELGRRRNYHDDITIAVVNLQNQL